MAGCASLLDTSKIQTKLLTWYSENKRPLPWRGAVDPYAVWISEIMLQQTTVTAVIPFYERWMRRFPTIAALAEAPVDDVLLHWAGLGYYARARNLHRAAQIVVAEFQGAMPHTPGDLIKLPGIGLYTAAAIASIAFGADAAAVDANITRVVCRLAAIAGDPVRDSKTKSRVAAVAHELLPKGSAGEFNQALMDLGAAICAAGRANCEVCPLAEHCRAFRLGNPQAYPAIARPVKTEGHRDVAVALTDAAGRVLLIRRPQIDPLWGGLWELPRVTAAADETLENAAARALGLRPLRAGTLTPFGAVKHVVANRKITLHGFRGRAEGCLAASEDTAWTPLPGLSSYALSTPQRKLLARYAAAAVQSELELG